MRLWLVVKIHPLAQCQKPGALVEGGCAFSSSDHLDMRQVRLTRAVWALPKESAGKGCIGSHRFAAMDRRSRLSTWSKPARVCLLALVAMAAPIAFAGHVGGQPEPGADVFLVAHDEGHPDSRATRPFWFEVVGVEGRNPTWRLEPGREVTVHLHNAGNVTHSLVFAPPGDAPVPVLAPDGTGTFTLRVPGEAIGWTTYGCALHEVMGMGGVLTFTGEDPEPRRFTMHRDDLVPFPPKVITEWVTIGGQILPAIATAAWALFVAWRRD